MKLPDCIEALKDSIETIGDYYNALYEKLKAYEKSIRESVEFIGWRKSMFEDFKYERLNEPVPRTLYPPWYYQNKVQQWYRRLNRLWPCNRKNFGV